MKNPLTKSILRWYLANKRDLPWRNTSDPYSILVSELMLQQTQVATVIPYYQRFLKQFPTANKLAAAKEERVLKAWEGLGYYRRARFLHAAAKKIRAEGFPETIDSILELPGAGEYTAAAVGSIALGLPAAVVDGNVIRVITRLFALGGDPSRKELKFEINKCADVLLDKSHPGDFNQAMMELGALICTPTQPDCGHCPAEQVCQAHKNGEERRYPELAARASISKVFKIALIIRKGSGKDEMLLMKAKRPDKEDAFGGQLDGLWHFPDLLWESAAGAQAKAKLWAKSEFGPKLTFKRALKPFKHHITRYSITVMGFEFSGAARAKGWEWINLKEVKKLPLAKAQKALLKAL